MTCDFSRMKKCEILPGFWYDAAAKSDPSMFAQIKITRDGFINPQGWKIVARGDNVGNNISIWWARTLDECKKYIEDTFIYGKPSEALRSELEEDSEFLKKDAHMKSWEIAQHIDYVLNHII